MTLAPTQIPINHLGELDISGKAALERMQHTLRKLEYVLNLENNEGNAFFIPLQDISFTSNKNRWKEGFSYGGILGWTSKNNIFFPSVRPNGCGVLLGKTNMTLCDPKRIEDKCNEYRNTFPENWDYNNGNHYIGLYKNHNKYYYLIHGGTRKFKKDNDECNGLYLEYSSWLQKNSEIVGTPFGKITILKGKSTTTYFNLFKKIERKILRSREHLAQSLFPESKVLFNKSHQRIFRKNIVSLGAYLFNKETTEIPLMIGPKQDLILLNKGLALNDLLKRDTSFIRILEQHPELAQLRIAPHGTGDIINSIVSYNWISIDKGIIELHHGNNKIYVTESPGNIRSTARSAEQTINSLNSIEHCKYETAIHLNSFN